MTARLHNNGGGWNVCLGREQISLLLVHYSPELFNIPPVHLNRCFYLAATQEREKSGKFSVFILTFDPLLAFTNLGTCSSHAVFPLRFLRMY